MRRLEHTTNADPAREVHVRTDLRAGADSCPRVDHCAGLDPCADHLLVDALRLDCDLPQQPIIHGDALSASIAAASILAKVERDRMIVEWDPVFPVYGLASNKGYSTPRHLAALREHGPSPLHRQSFAPVWNAPVPQDVLAFMLEEGEEFSSAGLRPA